MMRYVRGVLHPEAYHGHSFSSPFFEGWYIKLASESRTYAIIPGIFRGRAPTSHHAFIQVLDDTSFETTYHRFPIDAFRAADTHFEVAIGPNRFDSSGVQLELNDDQRCLRGRVSYDKIVPWPVRPWSPGVMGWYVWVPIMECYHGVVSLDHALNGELDTGAEVISFAGGRGYIEKDWGRNFPVSWIWLQCNHFEGRQACLSASIADVPWRGGSFPGFLVGLYIDGRLERFTTYTGAKVRKLVVDDVGLEWVLQRGRKTLEIRASRARTGRLRTPSQHDMDGCVDETLKALVEVRLTTRRGGRSEVVFEGISERGGLEIQGDMGAFETS